MSRRRAARQRPAGPKAEPAATSAAAAPPTEATTLSGTGATRDALLVGLGCLIAYAVTLCPTLVGGDSGELITVGARLAVPHPPGYPLYALLAHAFHALPFESAAWRVNLLSATSAAATAALLHASLRSLGVQRLGAATGALGFALAPLSWRYAVVAEVFALANMLVALALLLAVRAHASRSPRALAALAFACGLGMSNHHTFLFVAVPLVAWVLVKGRFAPRALALATAAGLLGLAPYLTLPLFRADDAASWGDPRSLAGLAAHVLRRDYGTFQLAAGGQAPTPGAGLWAALVALTSGTLGVGLLLAAVGARTLWRRRRGLALATLGALLSYLAVFNALANLSPRDPIHHATLSRFWLLPLLIAWWLAGVGAGALLEGRFRRPALAGLAVLLAVQAFLGSRESRRGDLTFARAADSTLASLPQGALLLSRGDAFVNAMRWTQEVEQRRLDVTAVPFELLRFPWARARARAIWPDLVVPDADVGLLSIVRANARGRAVFVTYLDEGERKALSPLFDVVAHPFVEEVVPRGLRVDPAERRLRVGAGFAAFDPRALPEPAPRSWEGLVEFQYRTSLGRHLDAELAASEGGGPDALRRLAASLEGALARAPKLATAERLRNLGAVYQRLLPSDTTARAGMERAWRRFLPLADPADPYLPAIRDALSARAAGP